MMVPLQRRTLPIRQCGSRLICRLEEVEKCVIRGRRLTHDIVWQNELPKIGTVEGLARLEGRFCESRRFGIGIGIERRIWDGPAPRPKSAAAHLVRVCLSGHPVRQIRNSRGMLRSPPAREPGDSQVWGAPEEMHRAALADK